MNLSKTVNWQFNHAEKKWNGSKGPWIGTQITMTRQINDYELSMKQQWKGHKSTMKWLGKECAIRMSKEEGQKQQRFFGWAPIQIYSSSEFINSNALRLPRKKLSLCASWIADSKWEIKAGALLINLSFILQTTLHDDNTYADILKCKLVQHNYNMKIMWTQCSTVSNSVKQVWNNKTSIEFE